MRNNVDETKTAVYSIDTTNTDCVRGWVRAAGVVGFALATALGAHAAIPLPGTPVPMTLQTLAVLLAGVTLGARLGSASMLLYVLLGAIGYHFFAEGEQGAATLACASGGYLVGFVLAQPVLGIMTGVASRSWLRTTAALAVGNAVIFGCGLAWLAIWTGGDVEQALAWGLRPFVPGMIVKTAAALCLAGLIGRRLRRFFEPEL